MHTRTVPILMILLLSGLLTGFSWIGVGGKCTQCAKNAGVCSVPSQSRYTPDHADGDSSHRHESALASRQVCSPELAHDCSISGGACTCSAQPSDVPDRKPTQPFTLQHSNPIGSLTNHPSLIRIAQWSDQIGSSITSSLEQRPRSNARRQAFLSIWQT